MAALGLFGASLRIRAARLHGFWTMTHLIHPSQRIALSDSEIYRRQIVLAAVQSLEYLSIEGGEVGLWHAQSLTRDIESERSREGA
jgi:hypothetical protein